MGQTEGRCPRCARSVTLLRTRRGVVVLDDHEVAPFSGNRSLRIRCPGAGRPPRQGG